jgi:hypothetical protein
VGIFGQKPKKYIIPQKINESVRIEDFVTEKP